MTRLPPVLIRAALAGLLLIPLALAAQSPLLQWRSGVYVLAGFAGIAGLALMLIQPLIIARALPGLTAAAHVWCGAALIALVVLHVAGLWITSPPDVVDVLLFRSPTPFGVWGALAMWAVFAAGLLALLRRRLPPRRWRLGHSAFVLLAASGTVLHAWMIQGTMEPLSKGALCLGVLLALAWALGRRRVWRLLRAGQ